MARRGRIRFRCWWCNKRHTVGGDRIGERLACTCGERMRVPRWSGMSSRDKRLSDWCIEILVYGGGGAAAGFIVGLFCIIAPSKNGSNLRLWSAPGWVFASILGVTTLIGFIAGLVAGEFGDPWVHWFRAKSSWRDDD